jgi:probable rRNA maturation factor
MPLTLANRQRGHKIQVRALKQIAATLLVEQAGPEAILEINLVSPAHMTRVNEEFLQHEGPTDVITFDYREEPKGSPLHGELFICPAVAVLQAQEFDTTWRSELVRYVIHGLLHLQGYDDRTAADRRRMKRVESRLLREMSRRFPLSGL